MTRYLKRGREDYAGRHKTEEYQRCRYYPDCEIHLGKLPVLRAQSEVGPGERQDIRAEFAAGTPRQSIAEAHRVTYTSVLRITKGQKPRTSRNREMETA